MSRLRPIQIAPAAALLGAAANIGGVTLLFAAQDPGGALSDLFHGDTYWGLGRRVILAVLVFGPGFSGAALFGFTRVPIAEAALVSGLISLGWSFAAYVTCFAIGCATPGGELDLIANPLLAPQFAVGVALGLATRMVVESRGIGEGEGR